MNCPHCNNLMNEVRGADCGELHHACLPCDLEYCTKFNEEEHISPRILERLIVPPVAKPHAPHVRKPRAPKPKQTELYIQIISEADGFLGDIMGEYAESQYSEQGGAVGMVEGRVQLKKDEIMSCMFEALSLVDNDGMKSYRFGRSFDLDGLRIDREKLVKFWYKRDWR